jgi:N-acetylglucosamine kinase
VAIYPIGIIIMYYGLDVGGTKIEFGAFDAQMNRLITERISTPQDDYNKLVNSIVDLINKHDAEFNCSGKIGIGIPGIESPVNQKVITPNILCANNQSLRIDIQNKLGCTVALENDANCFALSEAWESKADKGSLILGLILGTGFGGGFIHNDKVISGSNKMAGELGHISLSYNAWSFLNENLTAPIYTCGCGKKACLDNYLSGRGFENLYLSHFGEEKKATIIISDYYSGKEDAVLFVQVYLEFMAICLSDIFVSLDPELVYLGGGLSNFDALYDILPIFLDKYKLNNTQAPKIKKAKYGDSGGVRGAALLNY